MSKTEPKSWRDVIKIHPAADLFPMMSPDELKTLGEDIKANGLAQQIVLWTPDSNHRKWRKRGEFHLLDGRNRVAALESLGCISFDDDGWPEIIWPLFSGPIIFRPEVDVIILGPEVDPYIYVLSANIHRRHLTAEQKRDLIAAVLKAQPSKSNRTIAQQTKADHKTVGAVRERLEGRGEIPHVSTVEDTKGRKQPTHKARRGVDSSTADNKACSTTVVGRTEERSRQTQHIAEQVQASAQSVSIPKQLDIEHVLPDADRLVLEILERDQIAPGYAKAVMAGIAARLEVSGYPDMPDRREPTTAPDART